MSFAEILVIAIVGLIVVGPDRLPEALRKGISMFTRIKRAINDTKTEFEQQLGVDEIRRELHNEQVMKSLKALEEAQRETENEIQKYDQQVQAEIKRIESSTDEPVPHDSTPDEPIDDTEQSKSNN